MFSNLNNREPEELNNILQLLFKSHFDELSETEKQDLLRWRQLSAANESLYQEVFENLELSKELNAHGRYDAHQALTDLKKKLDLPRKRFSIKAWWLYAAAAVVLLAGAVWLARPALELDDAALVVQDSIQPGAVKAAIILADGSSIELDQHAGGVILGDSIRYADGRGITALDKPQLLTVRTPRGGEYKLTLPDGSQVWMNAETTITYASDFSRSNREIILDGEAFFDVNRVQANKAGGKEGLLPFRVISEGQEITVQGTSFNVSAYKAEAVVQTTLVEGALLVTASEAAGAGKAVVKQLSAGQQATWDGKKMHLAEVDTEPYVAWKEGYFVFESQTLAQIMNILGRWYDVEVQFESDKRNVRFTGSMSRSASIAEILEKLSYTQAVSFKVDGRRVVVM